MFTWTLLIRAPQRVDHVQRHADVAHEDLHRGLGVLVLEEELDAVLGADLGRLGDPLDEPLPRLRVRGLERVVVALDPGPADHVRADRAGELGRLAGEPARLGARRRVGRREPAAPEARVEVEPRADRVDPVPVERVAHLVEVVGVELAGIVELVVVDQVAETLDRAAHALGRRLAGVVRLVAAGHEARDHRAECPDAEARPHGSRQRPARSSRRRETVSSVTAASRIAPVTMYLIAEL